MSALVLGVIVGMIWGPGSESIAWVGTLFIRLIRMVVVPLVFVTLVSGVVAMGDPSKLGSLGVKTLAIYMATTLAAITIGLSIAAVLQPGVGVDLSSAVPGEIQEAIPLSERLMSIVPSNPFAALSEGNILAIIFFALLVGVSLLTIGEKGKPIADLMQAGSDTMLRITHWVMEVAPFGVFALIASVAGTQGVSALLDVVTLAIAVVLGCITHMIFVHGFIIMRLTLKLSPVTFFRGARDAMLVAFSTSSSSATLPVSMSVAEENLGIKPIVASTVLPLGATINMDGTALYEAVAALFIAQATGYDLSLLQQLVIAVTATLAAIGAAGIAGAAAAGQNRA
ncbi:MAG: dicarboxylate/amino acid:cation symporter [Proteobacteria bacterium]|nr:dicarboxylate/amino acid:cation symporter [Pseudomonadota bacterium]